MIRYPLAALGFGRRAAVVWMLAGLLGAYPVLAQGQSPKKIDVLQIGTSGSLALNASGSKDDTALEALQNFIKTETGFDNQLIGCAFRRRFE